MGTKYVVYPKKKKNNNINISRYKSKTSTTKRAKGRL